VTQIVTICTLVGLIFVVSTHIFIIARWSGKVDGKLDEIAKQPGDLSGAANAIRMDFTAQVTGLRTELAIYTKEVEGLRIARHTADGNLQLLTGRINAYDRIMTRLDTFIDHGSFTRRQETDA
jgi:hypothetical protein